jgi:hypothetical protein
MVRALMWGEVQAWILGGVRTVNHHSSHRRLIWTVDEPTRSAKVDAIIVPTARPVASLQQAAAAARRLHCPLVTLHSRKSSADRAVRHLDPRIDLIAIDVHGSASLRLPELKTSLLLADTPFNRHNDVSTKRNLALLLSHALQWKRVVFLDDDIRVPNPGDLSKAVSLLDTHTAVGLRIGGFPDNSMVCHAFREAGGSQDTFIGGGALAVDVKRNRTFFPNVYNEDWFFILDAGKRLQPVAAVGRAVQVPYDPYQVERAWAEELGDVLAEGTFWLLDQGRSVSAGDLEHWKDFLAKRKKFIEQVLSMVERSPKIEKGRGARMAEALMAALDRLKLISPELCVEYLDALAYDQGQWQRHIQAIRQQKNLSLKDAIESLTPEGAKPLHHQIRSATSPAPRTPRGHRSFVTKVSWRPRVQLSDSKAAMLSQSYVRVRQSALIAGRWIKPECPSPVFFLSQLPHAAVAAEVILACKESNAERDDYGDQHPSEQLQVGPPLSVMSR